MTPNEFYALMKLLGAEISSVRVAWPTDQGHKDDAVYMCHTRGPDGDFDIFFTLHDGELWSCRFGNQWAPDTEGNTV